MASPVVEGTTSGSSDGGVSNTDHTITLPGSIAAGELIIAFMVQFNQTSPAPDWSGTGFTTLVNAIGFSPNTVSIGYKKATGGESSIVITTSGTERSEYIAYRISGIADPDTYPPEISAKASAYSDYPNSASLTMSYGSGDYLWLSMFGAWGPVETPPFTSQPSGYSGGIELDNYLGAGSVQKATSGTDTEDPGQWEVQTAPRWAAYTVGIPSSDFEAGGATVDAIFHGTNQ